MTRLVTPSRPDFWNGTKVAGEPLTREQQAAVKSRAREIESNLSRYDLPRTYAVRKITEPRRLEDIPQKILITCPVVSATKDRARLKVIAPNGMDTWVEWRR